MPQRRQRPNFRLDVKCGADEDPAAKKRVYGSVYSYVRKDWKDMPALRAQVAKYMARYAKGMECSVTWGPYVLYSCETCMITRSRFP